MSTQELLFTLLRRQQTLAVAESLTGGLLASCLVNNPGASQVFRGGCVTYATDTKARVLGVDEQLLADHGAVDPVVALEMACNVAKLYNAQVGVATTGVAGPSSQDNKPVGCVYVAAVNSELIANTTQSYACLHAALENMRGLKFPKLQLHWETNLKVNSNTFEEEGDLEKPGNFVNSSGLVEPAVMKTKPPDLDFYQQILPSEWMDNAVVYHLQICGDRQLIREKTANFTAFVTNMWLNREI